MKNELEDILHDQWIVPCPCCGHKNLEHLDEGGDYIGCWPCEYERNRIREMAWTTSRLKRWLHRVLGLHIWFDSHCTRCTPENRGVDKFGHL